MVVAGHHDTGAATYCHVLFVTSRAILLRWWEELSPEPPLPPSHLNYAGEQGGSEDTAGAQGELHAHWR